VASAEKSAYVAAKHGVVGLTKVTALENATTGVTCNAICPGWVLTPLVQKQVDAKAAALGVSNERSHQAAAGRERAVACNSPHRKNWARWLSSLLQRCGQHPGRGVEYGWGGWRSSALRFALLCWCDCSNSDQLPDLYIERTHDFLYCPKKAFYMHRSAADTVGFLSKSSSGTSLSGTSHITHGTERIWNAQTSRVLSVSG